MCWTGGSNVLDWWVLRQVIRTTKEYQYNLMTTNNLFLIRPKYKNCRDAKQHHYETGISRPWPKKLTMVIG